MNLEYMMSRVRKEQLRAFGDRARGILVKADHGLFVVDPEDMYVSLTLLQHGKYAEDELEMFKTLVNKDSNVLIVGAHIGAHVIPLSKICNYITAIEANPNTFEFLGANVRLNACFNIMVYNVAANDKKGSIDFMLNTVNSGGSKRMPYKLMPDYIYDSPQTIKVESVRLDDDFLSDFDLIIMDIEGSEYFALKGMQKILSQSKVLAIEFVPDHIRYVANVGIKEFSDLILPHFKHMFTNNEKYFDHEATLAHMFEKNEPHNLIFFSK